MDQKIIDPSRYLKRSLRPTSFYVPPIKEATTSTSLTPTTHPT